MQRRSKNRDRTTTTAQTAPMRGGINSFCQTTDHRPTRMSQEFTNAFGHAQTMGRGTSRADHSDGLLRCDAGQQTPLTFPLKRQRRPLQTSKQRWPKVITGQQHLSRHLVRLRVITRRAEGINAGQHRFRPRELPSEPFQWPTPKLWPPLGESVCNRSELAHSRRPDLGTCRPQPPPGTQKPLRTSTNKLLPTSDGLAAKVQRPGPRTQVDVAAPAGSPSVAAQDPPAPRRYKPPCRRKRVLQGQRTPFCGSDRLDRTTESPSLNASR